MSYTQTKLQGSKFLGPLSFYKRALLLALPVMGQLLIQNMVALVDNFKVLDQKGCAPVKVQIHYLKPIPYEEYAGMKTQEVAALVRSRIEEKITEAISCT